jgi:ribosome-binding factor A
MRYRKDRHGGRDVPPFVDSEFAEALTGRMGEFERRPKPAYKDMQLCRQVQRSLNLSLGGESGDELLSSLYVTDVEPAPNATHLLARVEVPKHRSIAEAMTKLAHATPRLRMEVARAITRKRAPELTFIPATPQEVRP